MLGTLRPATMTTAAYLVLDPEEEALTIVSAGHPPPLVVSPARTADYLPVTPGVALGVSRTSRYREQRFDFPAGATILLYTDGIVEVRGESLDAGLERLREVGEHRPGPEELCDGAILRLFAGDHPPDDIALLAARLVPLGDELVTHWPAQPTALADVRHLLRRWLRHQGASEDERYDITVATQEACANAVEHAYAPGQEAFEVRAVRRGEAVEITVSDRGQWRRARGIHRGRGMPMMEALMDSVHVQHTPEGTAVVLRRAIGTGADAGATSASAGAGA